MKAYPGSALWLLRHELRMFLYAVLASGKNAQTRAVGWKLPAVVLALWLLLHLGAYAVLRRVPDADGRLGSRPTGGVGTSCPLPVKLRFYPARFKPHVTVR